MESQQQPNQENQQPNHEEGGGGGGASSGRSGNFPCRQSSTRWTPTSDQIRILKELYYNNGVRSPSAEHIQRISARLRQYGKIEGKNVFYWFQNHKARERQKKRFTTTEMIPMQRNGIFRPEDSINYNKYPILSHAPGVPSPSCSSSSTSSCSPAMLAVGQMGSYGYGSVTMEKSFRDCSISAGCSGVGGGSVGHNFWVGGGGGGGDPYSQYAYGPFYDKRKSSMEGMTHHHPAAADQEDQEEEQDEDQEEQPEIETLPLFPMHADVDINIMPPLPEIPNTYYYSSGSSGWYHYSDVNGTNGYGYGNGTTTSSRTSLELSLYSYAGRSSD